MKYEGIKIPDEVIIVEKPRRKNSYNVDAHINQGYAVISGTELESAYSWAGLKYNYNTLEVEEDDKKYIHKYKNGNFKFELHSSAGLSSQSGKLAFWNCVLIAEDDHKYLIGINSDLLIKILLTSTFENGKCSKTVWLGRVKANQVGVFTSDMDEFKQAQEDQKLRDTVKSRDYKPGDVVKTLTTKSLYLGEFYTYGIMISYPLDRPVWGYGKVGKRIILFNKPKKYHAYVDYYVSIYGDGKEHLNSRIDFSANKISKILTNDKDVENYIRIKNLIDDFKDNYSSVRYITTDARNYPTFDYPQDILLVSSSKDLSRDKLMSVFNEFNAYIKSIFTEDTPSYFYSHRFADTLMTEDELKDELAEHNLKLSDFDAKPYFPDYTCCLKNEGEK